MNTYMREREKGGGGYEQADFVALTSPDLKDKRKLLK
jgi:hypothetical protein